MWGNLANQLGAKDLNATLKKLGDAVAPPPGDDEEYDDEDYSDEEGDYSDEEDGDGQQTGGGFGFVGLLKRAVDDIRGDDDDDYDSEEERKQQEQQALAYHMDGNHQNSTADGYKKESLFTSNDMTTDESNKQQPIDVGQAPAVTQKIEPLPPVSRLESLPAKGDPAPRSTSKPKSGMEITETKKNAKQTVQSIEAAQVDVDKKTPIIDKNDINGKAYESQTPPRRRPRKERQLSEKTTSIDRHEDTGMGSDMARSDDAKPTESMATMMTKLTESRIKSSIETAQESKERLPALPVRQEPEHNKKVLEEPAIPKVPIRPNKKKPPTEQKSGAEVLERKPGKKSGDGKLSQASKPIEEAANPFWSLENDETKKNPLEQPEQQPAIPRQTSTEVDLSAQKFKKIETDDKKIVSKSNTALESKGTSKQEIAAPGDKRADQRPANEFQKSANETLNSKSVPKNAAVAVEEIAQLQAQLSDAQDQIGKLQQENASEKKESQATIERMMIDFQKKEARLLEAANEESQHESMRMQESFQNNIHELEERLAKERKDFIKKEESYRQVVESRDGQVEALENDIRNLQRKYESQMSQAEQRDQRSIRMAEDKLAQTLAIMDERDDEIKRLKSTIKGLEAKMSEHVEGVEEAEGDIEELETENENLLHQIGSLEAECTKLKSRVKSLEGDSDQLGELQVRIDSAAIRFSWGERLSILTTIVSSFLYRWSLRYYEKIEIV